MKTYLFTFVTEFVVSVTQYGKFRFKLSVSPMLFLTTLTIKANTLAMIENILFFFNVTTLHISQNEKFF